MAQRGERKPTVFESDPDAHYRQVVEIDVGKLDLQVALPFLPSNVKPVKEVRNIAIDQAVIGSCTNGRLKDPGDRQ